MEHACMIIEEAHQGKGKFAWYKLYNLILNFNSLHGNHAYNGWPFVWPQHYLYWFLTYVVAHMIDDAHKDSLFKGETFVIP